MEDFVAVRVIQANAMDLGLFQFDYDMSFGVTFLNADRTVYARYGSRRGNEEEADAEMSLEGLQATMQGVLALHENHPANADQLAGKQPRKPVPYPVPEAHPLLNKFTSKLDYDGKVAGSCIHCHQIRDVRRQERREAGEVLPAKLLTPYPMPTLVGFATDPKTAATVSDVRQDSPAAKAGLQPGDRLIILNGQRILSLADIQWVLHHLDDAPTTLTTRIERDGKKKDVLIPLAVHWDAKADISWRVSTWDLRRMALGGMFLEPLNAEERQALDLSPDQLALRAKHVGQYGDHGRAKQAGIQQDDIIVAFDGIEESLTESELIRTILGKKRPGETVSLRYLRNGRSHQTDLKLQ